MCLTTKDPVIKIAEQDIFVYKWLDYIRDKSWWKRTFNPTPPVSNIYGYYEYIKGVRQPLVKLEFEEYSTRYEVEAGYHADVTPDHGANAIFKIPKGAAYIEGWNNGDEYRKNTVSETIIYLGKIKD